MAEEVRAFRVQSFEDQARLIVEAALRRAEEIVKATQAQRDKVLEEARREGRERGLTEGRAEAARQERERAAPEVAKVVELLRAAAGALAEKRRTYLATGEQDLLKLALAIAERIVKSEVQFGKEVARANIRRAVELVVDRSRLKVRLNPADLQSVERYLPELRREFADLRVVELEAADSVSPGGCVVVTEGGEIDAQLETQLSVIERGLTA